MDDKCTHETSFVKAEYHRFSVLRCTWGCGLHLIELDLGNHMVATYTPAELTALTDLLANIQECRKLGDFMLRKQINTALELYEEQTKGT